MTDKQLSALGERLYFAVIAARLSPPALADLARAILERRPWSELGARTKIATFLVAASLSGCAGEPSEKTRSPLRPTWTSRPISPSTTSRPRFRPPQSRRAANLSAIRKPSPQPTTLHPMPARSPPMRAALRTRLRRENSPLRRASKTRAARMPRSPRTTREWLPNPSTGPQLSSQRAVRFRSSLQQPPEIAHNESMSFSSKRGRKNAAAAARWDGLTSSQAAPAAVLGSTRPSPCP